MLSGNFLTHLPPTLFCHLHCCTHTHRSLMLSDNLLTELPPTLFSGLDVLRYQDTLSHTLCRHALSLTL
jgi:hypothetical protein